jgi:hypothetical protein
MGTQAKKGLALM